MLSESDQHSDAAGSLKMQCVYCSKVYSGGVGRIRSHLLGNNSMKKCKDAPNDVIRCITLRTLSYREHLTKTAGKLKNETTC